MTEFYRNYLAVAVLMLAAIGMVAAMLGAGRLIRPSRPREEKLIAYELGHRAQLGTRLATSFSLFYNDYSDIRSTTPGPPTFPSFARGGFVRDPAGGVSFDDISISIRPWPGGGLLTANS